MKMDMTDQKIAIFKEAIHTFCLQIDKIVEQKEVGLSSFILTLCLADTASSYCSEKTRNQERFQDFIKKYLGKVNDKYTEEKTIRAIYNLRCTLVHNFSIANGVLLCEMGNPTPHLGEDSYGNIIIDLKSFYKDCKEAVIKYLYKDLYHSEHTRKVFKKNYEPPFQVFSEIAGDSGNTHPSGSSNLENTRFYKARKIT